MRIIAGNYRGKKLFSPESDKVRPTADRAREALFNILHSSLEKDWSAYKLLDVFAGTGAFALEALSRGAAAVALIDKDTRSLEKNVALFPKEKERISVFRQNVLSLPPSAGRYDLLFMDAPYNQGLSEPATACPRTRPGPWSSTGPPPSPATARRRPRPAPLRFR